MLRRPRSSSYHPLSLSSHSNKVGGTGISTGHLETLLCSASRIAHLTGCVASRVITCLYRNLGLVQGFVTCLPCYTARVLAPTARERALLGFLFSGLIELLKTLARFGSGHARCSLLRPIGVFCARITSRANQCMGSDLIPELSRFWFLLCSDCRRLSSPSSGPPSARRRDRSHVLRS